MEQFSNNASTTLNGAISSGATSLTVTSATGFPTVGNFRLLVESEIMLVTAVAGTTFTVTRGQEGTTATGHANGVSVFQSLTSGALLQFSSDTLPLYNVGHRLTLATGTPITTTDQVGISSLFFTPYMSNRIALFNGTIWKMYSVNEISMNLGGLTLGSNYDVFVYDNAGTVALELSAAWASDTTRTDAITRQDGVLVKASALTRRLVGTFRATGTGTTEDSLTKRFLSNLYNAQPRPLKVVESTANWTYNSATFRAANGNAANAVEFVNVDGATRAMVSVIANANGFGGQSATVGIALDSPLTTNAADVFPGLDTFASNAVMLTASYRGFPGLGHHTLTWIERSITAGNVKFYGIGGGGSQSGMVGEING